MSIRIGDSPAVDLYVRNQKRNAAKVGIQFVEKQFPVNISEAEVHATILNLNVDPRVTGIILQRPIPENLPIKSLQTTIHPLKDVEGMHPASIGNIVYRGVGTWTVYADRCSGAIEKYGPFFEGLEVTVIGHSEIVGKPIAFLLMAEGATATVCHHLTREVALHSRAEDAVLIAVGQAGIAERRHDSPRRSSDRYWHQSGRRCRWGVTGGRRLRLRFVPDRCRVDYPSTGGRWARDRSGIDAQYGRCSPST